MELVIMSGPSKSSKTTILDRLYNCLTGKEHFVEALGGYANKEGDHRVLFRGKDKNEKEINIVITSQGDNTDELLMNILFFINSSLYCKKNLWLLIIGF